MNTPRGPHNRTSHDYKLAEALSSDSAGPMSNVGLDGERLFLTFIDVSTRFAAAIPIFCRHEIPVLINATFNNFRDNYGRIPKIFVSNNAVEYLSVHVQNTLMQHSCEHVPTSTYSPEENGIAERLNRTLMEAVRTALHNAEMDGKYWPISLQDAVFKYNLRKHESTGRPPHYVCLGVDATPKRLLIFSQLGTVHLHAATHKKLEPCGQWTRYVHPVDRKQIMTMDQNGAFRVV